MEAWQSASYKTAYVETTILTLVKTASQIRFSVHLLTLSCDVNDLIWTEDIWVCRTENCCKQRATVGVKNHISYCGQSQFAVMGRTSPFQSAQLQALS